jgi:pantoate--beta-alanine ligase
MNMRIEKRTGGVRAFVQAARRAGRSVGLVPTMGALHAGHQALLQRSCGDNDATIVSVFVNPTQFGPGEDFAAYPRDSERDGLIAQRLGADLIFAPEPDEMYPEGFSTAVTVEGISAGLCGRERPGHFRGVATVVCKLLNIVQPDRAYFGEKDYQQLQVIRRMVGDLDMPVDIVPVPTVRESDGLAMSSRNAYLSPAEREVAPRLYQALQAGAQVVTAGGTGAAGVAAARAMLDTEPRIRVQYLEAVDPQTLQDKSGEGLPLVLALAVHLGNTRLIDNIIINHESR